MNIPPELTQITSDHPQPKSKKYMAVFRECDQNFTDIGCEYERMRYFDNISDMVNDISKFMVFNVDDVIGLDKHVSVYSFESNHWLCKFFFYDCATLKMPSTIRFDESSNYDNVCLCCRFIYGDEIELFVKNSKEWAFLKTWNGPYTQIRIYKHTNT